MKSEFINKCRLCLGDGKMFRIFDDSAVLATKLSSLAKIQICRDDDLPQSICEKCLKNLNSCVEFINLCQESDRRLRSLNIKRDCDAEVFDLGFSPKSDSSKDLSIDENVQSAKIDEELKKEDVTETDKLKSKHIKKVERQQCFTCGKVMSSRFRLKTHMLTHTKERPYVCQYCNKKFSLPENLKVHLRTHTGEKPFSCPVCGESFAHTAGLAAHKRKHTGTLPYKCVLCPRSFRTVGHLQYHTRRHTGEKNFECDVCNKAFITRSDLNKHKLSHSGDKAHVCCVCGLRLSRGSHLKRHVKAIHNTEKPFVCSYCPNKYSQKSDLEKHKMKHENMKMKE